MASHENSSQYGSASLSGLALRDASLTQDDTAAPTGFHQDTQQSQGNQDLNDPMFFESSIGNYQLQGSSLQGYNIDIALPNSQQSEEEDEEEEILTLGPNPSSQYQDQNTGDAIADNVSGLHRAPWNPFVATQSSRSPLQQSHMSQSYLTPQKQRNQPFSESGYFTGSVRSGRSGSFSRETGDHHSIPRSMPAVQNLNLSNHIYPVDMDVNRSRNRQLSTSDAVTTSGSICCPVASCSWTGKTPSDLKKHAARHDLANVCDIGDCAQAPKGFATVNDLQRHQKTVHKKMVEGDRMFKCFAKNCAHPDKEWPRKDNFKSHLNKLHPHEKAEILLKKSEDWWIESQGQLVSSVYDAQTASPTTPVSHTSHYQNAATQFSLSPSGSSQQQSHGPGMNPQFLANPFMMENTSIDSYMPGTSSWNERSQYEQQLRNDASSGYSGVNPAQQQARHASQSSSQNLQLDPSQRKSAFRKVQLQAQAFNPAGYQIGQTRSGSQHRNQDGQQMSQSQRVNPSSIMHRSVSGKTFSEFMPTSYQQTSFPSMHHGGSQTVADPNLCMEPDRLRMAQQPSLQFPVPPDEQNYPNDSDLTGIGGASFFSTDVPDYNSQPIPKIVVQSYNEKGSGSATSGTNNIESLREFLSGYKRQLEHSGGNMAPFQSVLDSISKSVSGGTTTADSSDVVPASDIAADAWIQETPEPLSKGSFRCLYPKCSSTKRWERRCEIKKHIKRHTKPYGCTFENCYKRFGAKSDWIRHETKKHVQQEGWRCDQPRNHPELCRTMHSKRDAFQNHLKDEHMITEQHDLNRISSESHINNNFQPQFWCGLCKKIKSVKQKGKPGMHERYDHITSHLIDEGKTMDEWMPPGGTLNKGQLLNRMSNTNDDDNDQDDGAEDDSPPGDSPGLLTTLSAPRATMMTRPRTQSQPHPHQHQHQHQQQDFSGSSSQKRTATEAGLDAEGQGQQRMMRAQHWQCCQCGDCNLYATMPACLCAHGRCEGCPFLRNHPAQEEMLGFGSGGG